MAPRASGLRLFGWYVLASAVPIALLGFALAQQYEAQANHRALDQAADVANAISYTGIEPVLVDQTLTHQLGSPVELRLYATTAPLMQSHSVLRLRLRDRTGRIVFDASHPPNLPRADDDDEAVEAAEGHVVRRLTRLNSDEVRGSTGAGVRAVEVYLPVHEVVKKGQAVVATRHVIGVLEIYLPYAPIAQAFDASNHMMLELIAFGLVALWLALSMISWSVTQRLRRSAKATEHLALHDILTGLPNRALFVDRAAEAVASARRSGDSVGIAIVDLDRFKELNDTLGHHNGDAYLRHIAVALADVLRPVDTIARLGGDEFGLVLPGVDSSSARLVLTRVLRTLALDVDVVGVPVSSEASIGIAFWPTDGTEVNDLLQCADLAMYAAKETHQPIVDYAPELAHFSPERLAVVSQLRQAIASDQLVLHYQPKLDLRTNQVDGVEALLRWHHPTRGLLAPADFLDVAESTGLIDPLTDWVLDHAIAQVADWHRRGVPLGVAVNVSARNLRNEALPATVLERLTAHGVGATSLEIEITETALIAEPARATSMLRRLRTHGVRVSLDDFGQGYTSLSQLGALPLTEIKIDRSFVAGMLVSPDDRTIVSTLIELGHNFGLEVVAEGAESDEVIAALTSLGCDIAQGFVLTPALPAEELLAWIRQYERTSPSPVS